MTIRRLAVTIACLIGFAAAAALAQVPPLGSAVDGWLQAIFNQLSDGTSGGPRTIITASATGTTAGATATLPGVARRCRPIFAD